MKKDLLLLGLDIGATKCAVIVGDKNGRILDRIQWPSSVERGPEHMIEDLCQNAHSLLEQNGGTSHFSGVGISIGGPLNSNTGVIHSPPNLPGWNGIEVKKIIHGRLGLPVNVEHDAASGALAEYLWGAGQNAQRLVYLTCGSGFGAGIVMNGAIYTGSRGRSPEIGHIRYSADGPNAFGKTGSYEAFCAGNSLPKLAAYYFPKRWKENPPDGKTLNDLAHNGDQDAEFILETNARAVGSACALLGDLLVPQVIILGSLALYLGEKWINIVRRQFTAQALDEVSGHCQIKPSVLGKQLQDCAALAVAFQN